MKQIFACVGATLFAIGLMLSGAGTISSVYLATAVVAILASIDFIVNYK